MTKHAILCACALFAGAASAQPVALSDPARQLSAHLNTLAVDGRNLFALIGAGEAAVELEDAQAAAGFFGRAEEIDPRNRRVKAGKGRALLLLERPRDALLQFDMARALGMPEADLAIDRGLAYDLLGDQRSAQRDYGLAVRGRDGDEATRRLAISLAISGDRERALNLLEPLQRRDDRAAWRARAFVLALSGDVAGANGVLSTMNPQLAGPMAPFFARLGRLSPAQKAHAAHLGVMPADGRSDGPIFASADPARSRLRADEGLIPAGQALGPPAADARTSSPPARLSTEPRRRPGDTTVRAQATARFTPAPAASGNAGARGATVPVAPRPAAPTPAATSPVVIARAETPQVVTAGRSSPASPSRATVIDRTGASAPGFTDPVLPPAAGGPSEPTDTPALLTGPTPLPVGTLVDSLPARQAPTPVTGTLVDSLPKAPASIAAVTAPTRSLAEIAGGLTLEQSEAVAPPIPVRRQPVARVAAVVEKPAPKAPPKKKPEPKPDPKTLHPERVWAQVATGADRRALAADFGRMAKKTPAAFKGQASWTAPFKATRRLLVGPFSTEKAAQAFIKKAGVTGFAWTSPAGTEVEKLGGK